jgi:hypothetical protein
MYPSMYNEKPESLVFYSVCHCCGWVDTESYSTAEEAQVENCPECTADTEIAKEYE